MGGKLINAEGMSKTAIINEPLEGKITQVRQGVEYDGDAAGQCLVQDPEDMGEALGIARGWVDHGKNVVVNGALSRRHRYTEP